jgi:DNA repair protein RadC
LTKFYLRQYGCSLAAPLIIPLEGMSGKKRILSCVLFLNAQHRMFPCEELFRGTVEQTSVYPREVVKEVLAHNTAAVIFALNHPSDVANQAAPTKCLRRR